MKGPGEPFDRRSTTCTCAQAEKREALSEGERGRLRAVTDRERERVRGELQTEIQVSRFFGRVVAVLGMVAALAGDLTASDAGPAGPLGLLMGALGYCLGARWLVVAAILLSATEIVVGFVV